MSQGRKLFAESTPARVVLGVILGLHLLLLVLSIPDYRVTVDSATTSR